MGILDVKNLFVEYNSNNFLGKSQSVYAVNGVSFEVKKGEIFSIAGESGCGKSSLLRAVAGLIDIKSGNVGFDGEKKDVQVIFQTPGLNPKMKIKDILLEPMIVNKTDKSLREKKLFNVLNYVGLSQSDLNKFPHEFSGGQKQRISIARALILEPKVLLADEPVSALDVSIQGQIINLLKSLNKDFGLTIVFISHDLNVIRYISDRVAIMYLGEIVEQGLTDEIFMNPLHPYTKALLSANPSCKAEREILKGELPSPVNLPTGCKFHARCSKFFDGCDKIVPKVVDITGTHSVMCRLFD